MDQVIFKYPDQVFVGLATRKADRSLNHEAFALVKAVPKMGDAFADMLVVEVITDDALLTDTARRAIVDKMAAIVVLKRTT
jgi:hypothetical protein